MWQKDTGIDNNKELFQWCDALSYSDGLELGGHADWRLPNIKELLSIFDYSEGFPAISAGHPFLEPIAWSWGNTVVWSSTTAQIEGKDRAITSGLVLGNAHPDNKFQTHVVGAWSVRDAPSP